MLTRHFVISTMVLSSLVGCNSSSNESGTGGAAGSGGASGSGASGGAAGNASGGAAGATGGAAGSATGGAAGAAGASCETGKADTVTFTYSCTETVNNCTGSGTVTLPMPSGQTCGALNGSSCLVPSLSDGASTVDFSLCPYTGAGSYPSGSSGTALWFDLPGSCPSGPTDFQPDTTAGSCDIQVTSDCENGGQHHIQGTFSCPQLAYGNITCSITAGSFDFYSCSF